MTCDQCQAATINGVFCHETGCPNAKKTWIDGRGWVRFVECRQCGDELEAGETCSCQTRYDDDDEADDDDDEADEISIAGADASEGWEANRC